MWKLIAVASITAMAGAAILGAILAVASLLADLPVVALNAVIIPISTLPAIGFLIWIGKERRSPLVKAQNVTAGFWIVSLSTAVGYAVLVIPVSTTTAVIATTGIEIFLWVALYQMTRRLYMKGRQKNIAAVSRKSVDDPEIRNLSDNHDLATAIVTAMLFTTKSIILMQSNFASYLSPEAMRVVGIILGCSVGLLLFNFCPNQTKIRAFISCSRTLEE